MAYEYQKECFCGAHDEDVTKHGASEDCKNGKGGSKRNPAFDLYELTDHVTPEAIVAPVEASWCVQTGRSPGSTIRSSTVATMKECQQACENEPRCKAIVKEASGLCFLLDRTYDANFEFAPDGHQLANKGHVVGCPIQDHIGCFKDKPAPNPDRVLGYYHQVKEIRLEQCATVCRTRHFFYMGYQYQSQCWCGAEVIVYDRHGASEDCVNGLGGPKPKGPKDVAFDLYEISESGAGLEYEGRGCFQDDADDRAMSVRAFARRSENIFGRCYNRCKKARFDMFAMERQVECWCGHSSLLNTITKHGSSFHCKNEKGHVGGFNRDLAFNLYQINY